MDMKTKALTQALEALKFAYNECDDECVRDMKIYPAIGECEKALKQPEQPPMSVQPEPKPVANKWRDLALQFDAQRMSALANLRMMVQDPAKHIEVAREFLAAAPQPPQRTWVGQNSYCKGCICPEALNTSQPAPVQQGWPSDCLVSEKAKQSGFDLSPMPNLLYTVRGNHAQLVNFARAMLAAAPQPPQRPWVGLTPENVMAIGRELGLKCRLGGNPNIDFDYAQAIEAKLKKKNT